MAEDISYMDIVETVLDKYNLQSTSSGEKIFPLVAIPHHPDKNYDLYLKKNQMSHVLRCIDKINKYGCYIDTSQTGAGKNICAGAIALLKNAKTIVICPAQAIGTWLQMLDKYWVQNLMTISYETLRGQKDYAAPEISGREKEYILELIAEKYGTTVELIHQGNSLITIRKNVMKNNFLVRYDSTLMLDLFPGKTKLQLFREEVSIYQPGQDMFAILDNNGGPNDIMVIFDEFHKTMNIESKTSQMCDVIVNELRTLGKKVFFAFLSATPGNKMENALGYLRIFGYHSRQIAPITTKSTSFVIKDSKGVKHKYIGNGTPDAVIDIIETLQEDDPDYVIQLLPSLKEIKGVISWQNYDRFCYSIYETKIAKKFNCSMPGTVSIKSTFRFMKMLDIWGTQEDFYNEYMDWIAELNELFYMFEKDPRMSKEKFLRILSTIIHHLEESKAPLFARAILETFYTTPNIKIIVMTNNVSTIGKIIRLLMKPSSLFSVFPPNKIIVSGGKRSDMEEWNLLKNEYPAIRFMAGRQDAVRNIFQSKEDPLGCQLILATRAAYSESISLHDVQRTETSEYPRVTFSTATYDYNSFKQSIGRTTRDEAEGEFFILNGLDREGNLEELRIIGVLYSKEQVAQEYTRAEHIISKIIFRFEKETEDGYETIENPVENEKNVKLAEKLFD